MQLGMHLRELWKSRFGLPLSLILAFFVSLPVTYDVSLSPLGLQQRSLEIAAASAHVMVDTPRSAALDLRQGTYEMDSMIQRTVLLGNVVGSPSVRDRIARSAGVEADQILVTTPTTPKFPRAIADPQNQRSATDIAKAPDEYRIKVSANPTVPILDIYAEAPDIEGAEKLANGAVRGLEEYLAAAARNGQTPVERQVKLRPLGTAKGGVINGGVHLPVMIASFLLAFGIAAAASLHLARLRRGWRLAESLEKRETQEADQERQNVVNPRPDAMSIV
jgi:hypothetical protein